MRILQLITIILLSFNCFSQGNIPIRRIDTLLPFFGKKPLNLHGYDNRSVPYNSVLPLYVMITYAGGKSKSLEYFRMDSSTYLVYQFFRSEKGSSNGGLKSAGKVKIIDSIVDSSYTTAIGRENDRALYKRYYKAFNKEGEWDEYEDSLFHHQYWTGRYKEGKKVGVWRKYIYDPNDDRLIMQINYDEDSTLKLFAVNLANTLSLDSISYLLNGRWRLGCEDNKDRRMLMSKYQLYDGHYGDDGNSIFGAENYYDFLSKGMFKRQKGETCDKFNQISTSGQWKVSRKQNDLILEIKLKTGYTLKYKVLYLDREGNMVADRQ